MRCRKARRYIELKLDNELRENRVPSLEKHLSGCAECRGFQAQSGKLDTMLRSRQLPEFPSWLHHQILSQANQHDGKRLSFNRRWKLSAIPALLAVVLSLTFGTLIGKAIYGSPGNVRNRTVPLTATDVPASQIASFGESTLIEDIYDSGETQ